MEGEGWVDLGMAWNAAYWEALKMWRNEYAPAVRLEDLFANHLRRVTFASNVLPGGTVEIMVKVLPRDRALAENYFWKCRHLAGLYYFV